MTQSEIPKAHLVFCILLEFQELLKYKLDKIFTIYHGRLKTYAIRMTTLFP